MERAIGDKDVRSGRSAEAIQVSVGRLELTAIMEATTMLQAADVESRDQARVTESVTTVSRAHANLERVVADFLNISCRPAPDDLRCLQTVIGMHSLACATRVAEASGVLPPEILRVVEPARRAHAMSPLINRFQTWPRGYPGDFETIEWLYESRNEAEPGTFAFSLEQCALNSVLAQQHRNKIDWQARRAEDICSSCHDKSPRILSVGCGGSIDLRQCLKHLQNVDAEIVLNDYDAGALQHSAARLSGLRSTLIKGHVLRAAREILGNGPYDLVLAGGLFDYLLDEQLQSLLPRLVGSLSPNGALCFTNMVSDNPYRTWMTYFANWALIHRSEVEVNRLVHSIRRNDVSWNATRDATGLAILVHVRREVV